MFLAGTKGILQSQTLMSDDKEEKLKNKLVNL